MRASGRVRHTTITPHPARARIPSRLRYASARQAARATLSRKWRGGKEYDAPFAMNRNLSRPHGEERCEAARLEPCGRPILRDAALRAAPQDEAERSCGVWIPGPALARRPEMTKKTLSLSGLTRA
jgi:hypothetical protein